MKMTHYSKQQGAVLIITLIVLLVMTIFGLTSMNTSLLQSKMSTNAQNTNRTFQAAESAIGSVISQSLGGGAGQALLTTAMNSSSNQTDVINFDIDDEQVSAGYLVRYRGEITLLSGNSLDADESSTILRGHRFELVGVGTVSGSNAQSIIRQGTEYR